MNLVAAITAAVAVFLVVGGGRRVSLADELGGYLLAPQQLAPDQDAGRRDVRWFPWVISGGLVGVLLAQGDLFLAGAGRSIPALGALGAGGGYVAWSMKRTNARERRARRLRIELPVVIDALALNVIAGGSVSSAIRAVVGQLQGVASEELVDVLHRADHGDGLEASLMQASHTTAHADARRLYDLLAHAHVSGGRLATMLTELALDLRAGLERDLSAEGGKRAVASYGPILALMIPTALLFLLYPTLIGLRALGGSP